MGSYAVNADMVFFECAAILRILLLPLPVSYHLVIACWAQTMMQSAQRKAASATLDHRLAGSLTSHPPARHAATDDERAEALLDLAIALVDSALDILYSHLISDEQLRKASYLMPGGTVGKHMRHVSCHPSRCSIPSAVRVPPSHRRSS